MVASSLRIRYRKLYDIRLLHCSYAKIIIILYCLQLSHYIVSSTPGWHTVLTTTAHPSGACVCR